MGSEADFREINDDRERGYGQLGNAIIPAMVKRVFGGFDL